MQIAAPHSAALDDIQSRALQARNDLFEFHVSMAMEVMEKTPLLLRWSCEVHREHAPAWLQNSSHFLRTLFAGFAG